MKYRTISALIFSFLLVAVATGGQCAQASADVSLPAPEKTGGLSIMESFSNRASTRQWADRDISRQQLSNLLWAANGVNRPDRQMRTAASAGNAQDVTLYVFTRDGVYRYEAVSQTLVPIVSGDHRSEIGGGRRNESGEASLPPVTLILVTDLSKFAFGDDEQKHRWAAIDVGIVSANISLFCAGNGLGTCPMAGFDEEALTTMLKLTDTQKIYLKHPVGYLGE